MIDLYPYQGTWEATDPHAHFKADVAHYIVLDPLPTLENLSQATGIPGPCLIRYRSNWHGIRIAPYNIVIRSYR
jgi:hypothetical protein